MNSFEKRRRLMLAKYHWSDWHDNSKIIEVLIDSGIFEDFKEFMMKDNDKKIWSDDDILTKKMHVNYELSGGTEQQRSIVKAAIDELDWLLNESTWRHNVLNHAQYEQTKITNRELLKRFVQGDERGRGNIDYEMDLRIRFYFKKFSRVIGYVNINDVVINMNTKYFPRSIPSIINNMIHEYSHLTGGNHSYKRSPLWPKTSPYYYGAAAQTLIEDHLGIVPTSIYRPRVSLWRRIKRWFRF